ncbi:MAG: trypsin-like peptidase domain-containing protein [Chloroflexota bacterium]
MSFQSVEQGIGAIQAGNRDEGVRLLKIALKNPELTGALRAIACLWLGEVATNPDEKGTYYKEALKADPTNAAVKQRVEGFLAQQFMPPTSTQTAAQAAPPMPTSLPGALSTPNPYAPMQPALPKTGNLNPPVLQPNVTSSMAPVVLITGGANGPATAFFVAREGLLATTRYAIGGADQVIVELSNRRQVPGYVLRSYPELDLAFIYVEQTTGEIIPPSPIANVTDDTRLTVVCANGTVLQGKRRATKRLIAAQWFPTDIMDLPDAGGAPILDDSRYLIGMITRNTASTSAYVYGLHINTIRTQVDLFRQETTEGAKTYCRHCGFYSRALSAGGYYCERCGGLHPQAEGLVRFPQAQTQAFYYEHNSMSCPNCNANVGFYRNNCLRCGQPATRT